MTQQGHVNYVKSDSAAHFTGAIAQNAGELESIDANNAIGITGRSRIAAVVIRSTENLDWELLFFATAAGNHATVGTNRFLGAIAFVAADADRVGGAGLYLYGRAGLNIPYFDLDRTSKLHVMLVNRSVAAKSAAGAGLLDVEVMLEPTGL